MNKVHLVNNTENDIPFILAIVRYKYSSLNKYFYIISSITHKRISTRFSHRLPYNFVHHLYEIKKLTTFAGMLNPNIQFVLASSSS